MPGPNPNPAPVAQWFQVSFHKAGDPPWKTNPVVDQQPAANATDPLKFSNPETNAPYKIDQWAVGQDRDKYQVEAPYPNSPVLIQWTNSGTTYSTQTNTGSYGYTDVNSPDVVTLN